jgi:hypothetical protein
MAPGSAGAWPALVAGVVAPENYFPFAISPSGVWLALGLLDSQRQRSRGAVALNSLGESVHGFLLVPRSG